MTTFDDLSQRIADLESKQLGLDDLPIAQLQRRLEQQWLGDAVANLGTSPLALAYARVRCTSAPTIPTAAYTAVPWQVADKDPAGMWSSGTPTRLTAKTTGLYLVETSFEYGGSAASGHRLAHIRLNGTGEHVAVGGNVAASFPAAAGVRVNAAAVVSLAAGDYVEGLAYQDSGGGLALLVGGEPLYPHMTMTQLA